MVMHHFNRLSCIDPEFKKKEKEISMPYNFQ